MSIVSSLSIASAHGGGTVAFSVGDGSRAGGYWVEELSWKSRIQASPVTKLIDPGMWPTWGRPRELVVDLEGRIVGSSPTNMWSKRTDLLEACMPPYAADPSIREHGTLTITVPGQPQAYLTVNVAELEAPLTSQIARSCAVRISWVAYFGYWRRVDTDAPILL